ncbi:hypothetical protein PENTCL1PPCAC_19499, partial [Pristionchus entomophagus]
KVVMTLSIGIHTSAILFGIIGISLSFALSAALFCIGSMSPILSSFRFCLHISASHGFLLSSTYMLTRVSFAYFKGYYLHPFS